jgi:hypothetical protein
VRSLVAEAALVSRLADHHQLTASYAIQAQKIIRAQLQSELRSMDSVGDGANQIRAALAAMQTHNQRGLDRSEQELTQEVKAREKAR